MKGLTKTLCSIAAVVLIMSPKVWGEDSSLDKIVITASRVAEPSENLASSVDVITKKDIERSQAKDVAQVLTNLTSVTIDDYGTLGATKTIKMRGSSSSQVLVLIDGRPINNPRDGVAELSSIPLDNVERIEVMHGGGSSLYGSGAIGGTVNIITKEPPRAEKQKTEVYSSFGTFRTYDERFSTGARKSGFGYFVSGGYQKSSGFRDNSEFDAKDANAKFEYALNDRNNLSTNFGFYRSRVGTPGSIISPDFDDKQRILRNFQDANWNYRLDDSALISAKMYQNYDRLEFIENTAGSIFDVANSKSTHTTTTNGYDVQCDKQFTTHYQGIAGLNYVVNENNSTNSGKHRYTVQAAYLENKFNFFNERVRLNCGGRIDDYSNFGAEFSPSLSFLFAANNRVKLRGSINRSFRAPTFNDLYWPDEGWAKGNPNLSPERGITKELGIELNPTEQITSSITYFRSDYTNLINWSEAAGIWQPTNINSALIDGIEYENKIKMTDRWSLNSGYTFLNAKDKDTQKFIIYQPKHKVDLSLEYKDVHGFICELKGQLTSTRFHDAENTIKVKRFYDIGLNVSKEFAPGKTCFASFDNLFAKHYQVVKDYPMPGFSFTGGVKLEF